VTCLGCHILIFRLITFLVFFVVTPYGVVGRRQRSAVHTADIFTVELNTEGGGGGQSAPLQTKLSYLGSLYIGLFTYIVGVDKIIYIKFR
jgi:hypothetical protein